MITYTYTSPETSLTVTSDTQMYYDDIHVSLVVQRTLSYNQHTPLTRLRFWYIAPNQYRYKVWLRDGREYKQELYFDDVDDFDPMIEFNLGNQRFRATEILYNQEIKPELFHMVRGHGMTDWDLTIN